MVSSLSRKIFKIASSTNFSKVLKLLCYSHPSIGSMLEAMKCLEVDEVHPSIVREMLPDLDRVRYRLTFTSIERAAFG